MLLDPLKLLASIATLIVPVAVPSVALEILPLCPEPYFPEGGARASKIGFFRSMVLIMEILGLHHLMRIENLTHN